VVYGSFTFRPGDPGSIIVGEDAPTASTPKSVGAIVGTAVVRAHVVATAVRPLGFTVVYVRECFIALRT
jgi:hypothetical protein